jgi:hypothetical protein
MKVHMTVPNIFLDGSKYGLYLSSIEPNNKLFLNPEYNQLNSLVRKETIDESDTSTIEKLLENMKFKNHPDIRFLQGLYLLKKECYKEAKATFDSIYDVYSQNQCIINNESEFLQVYMNTFKHIQS